MLTLPTESGQLEPYSLAGDPLRPRAPEVAFDRVAFAAAHVVADPIADRDPWMLPPAVDWEQTMRFRHWLWDQGLHLAEAMDTAQRGMGVDWPTARELIERTMREARARAVVPRVACGAGTDGRAPEALSDLPAIRGAYLDQMEAIEKAGGEIVLMASRALPAIGARSQDYLELYADLIDQAARPVILHWLGPMFDPALEGYWGARDLDRAEAVVRELIEARAPSIEGIKISLLDRAREERLRAALPEGVKLYTGDDFDYAELIAGDGTRHSHALLGAFAAIAPAASQALEALARGEIETYRALLAPTVPLSREIFRAPTRFYKAGVAFLAWLNDAQSHFAMPAGLQSARGIVHYAALYRLADRARLLSAPEIAEARMAALAKIHGVE